MTAKAFITTIILFLVVTEVQGQWVMQRAGITHSLNGIFMLDGQEGWVVGGQGQVYHLTNAGYTWTAEGGLDPTIDYNKVWFVRDGTKTGWCVGKRGRIHKRNTQGEWEQQNSMVISELLAISGAPNNNVNDHDLWVVGFSNTIRFSSNSGDRWDPQVGSGTAYRDIEMLSPLFGFIVGNGGLILRTGDSGANWIALTRNTDENLHGLLFANFNSGWAVGSNGVILATTNGGDTWSPQNTPTAFRLNAITGIDNKNLIAVGDTGAVVMSSDGGVNWRSETIQAGFSGNFFDVAMADAENYWIVGANGTNFYSEGTVAFGAEPVRLGERLKVDTVRTISFVTRFNSTVNIDFSSDGSSWERLPNATAIASSVGSYNWTIPPTPSTTCRLRLSSSKKPQVQALSPIFTIFDGIRPEVSVDTSSTKPIKGEDLIITATITDNNATINTLFYRRGGDSGYRERALDSLGANQYRATILAREGDDFVIDERGLEFYIKAVDTSPDANTGTFGTEVNPIFLPVSLTDFPNAVLNSEPNNGGAGEIYQMVTIPYKLADASISKVLEPDLGAYDPHHWRLWAWLTEEARYGEFTKSDIGDFTQGKSFWLASTKDRFLSRTGQSYKPETVNIVLRPGWNQIGHPFAFPVRVEDILAATGDTAGVGNIWDYNNKWEEAVTLEPGKGYFIQNRRTANLVLTVPPVATTLSKSSKPEIAFLKEGWHIQLCLQAERAVDDYNFIGAHEFSTLEWDRWDQPEPPPPPGKYVSLSLPHQDWQTFPDEYTTDFRSATVEAEVWNVNIAGNLTGAATRLEAHGLESLPGEFAAFLLDEKLGFAQNLREEPGYTFVLPHGHKELKIVVGKADLIQQNYLPSRRIPIAYELSPNFPNPFNLATGIRFGLPSANMVTLKIYDMLGREIRTLLSSRDLAPGFHVEVWDGKDGDGATVASGVYFYHLRAKGFSQIRKMTLVRNAP